MFQEIISYGTSVAFWEYYGLFTSPIIFFGLALYLIWKFDFCLPKKLFSTILVTMFSLLLAPITHVALKNYTEFNLTEKPTDSLLKPNNDWVNFKMDIGEIIDEKVAKITDNDNEILYQKYKRYLKNINDKEVDLEN